MEQACYIISYDLCQPGKNYNELYTVLKSFPYWGKLTESTWAVVSSNTAVEIRNTLTKYIDVNDRLIVIRSGRNAAWTTMLAGDDWLRTNLVK